MDVEPWSKYTNFFTPRGYAWVLQGLIWGFSAGTFKNGISRALPQAHTDEGDIVQLGPLAFPRCEEPLEVVFLLWAGFVGDFPEALPALRLGF